MGKQNPAANFPRSLGLLSHQVPYACADSGFCSSTLTPQVPQRLAFVSDLVASICLLCPLSVALGEQTKISYRFFLGVLKSVLLEVLLLVRTNNAKLHFMSF